MKGTEWLTAENSVPLYRTFSIIHRRTYRKESVNDLVYGRLQLLMYSGPDLTKILFMFIWSYRLQTVMIPDGHFIQLQLQLI